MSTGRVAHDPSVAVRRRHLPGFAREERIYAIALRFGGGGIRDGGVRDTILELSHRERLDGHSD